MGQVVAITATEPIDRLVIEIRGHVHDAGRAQTTCAKHQLQAGMRLIELRARVEREGGDWWSFFDDKFTGYIKSRSYAEKLMRWAQSDDPEGAIEAAKERNRENMQRSRALASATRVAERDTELAEDLVGKALRLVAKMNEAELENFHQLYMEKFR